MLTIQKLPLCAKGAPVAVNVIIALGGSLRHITGEDNATRSA